MTEWLGMPALAAAAQELEQMHAAEPAFTDADLSGLDVPVLVLLGDDDETRLEHAVVMHRALMEEPGRPAQVEHGRAAVDGRAAPPLLGGARVVLSAVREEAAA